MSPDIVHLLQLQGSSAANLASTFGLKTAGCVQLLEARAASPVPYVVPSAYAIPVAGVKRVSSVALRSVFDAFTQGRQEPGVIMARSSSRCEAPGQNPTYFVAHHPQRLDASFQRFQEAVHRLGEASAEMGVLLMPMVHGEPLHFRDMTLLGARNLSFVADSHHPMSLHEMYFAFVEGLGTRVVDANDDFIPITVERDTGQVTSFVNKAESAIRKIGGSVGMVIDVSEYRQKIVGCFALETDAVIDLPMEELVQESVAQFRHHPFFVLERGAVRVLRENEEIPDYGNEEAWNRMQLLGRTPFETPETLSCLASVLQYLARRSAHPVQVEGALIGGMLNLYQLIEVPAVLNDISHLDLEGAILSSTSVIGSCDFQGPMVSCRITDFWNLYQRGVAEELEKIDREYAGQGYALLAPVHTSALIECTPHCRVRLSLNYENLASHAVTLARMQLAKDKRSSIVFAMEVKKGDRFGERFPHAYHDILQVLDSNVHIRSNGRTLRIDSCRGRLSEGNLPKSRNNPR